MPVPRERPGFEEMKVQVQVTCVGLLKGLQDFLVDLDFFYCCKFTRNLERARDIPCFERIKAQVQVTCVGLLEGLQDFLADLHFFIVVSLQGIWKEPETFYVLKELKSRFRSHVWDSLRDSKTFWATWTFSSFVLVFYETESPGCFRFSSAV